LNPLLRDQKGMVIDDESGLFTIKDPKKRVELS